MMGLLRKDHQQEYAERQSIGLYNFILVLESLNMNKRNPKHCGPELNSQKALLASLYVSARDPYREWRN